MKPPIFFFLLCAGALQAQTVTVYNRYVLYPDDSIGRKQVYFDGRTVPVFTVDDYSKQLDLAAKKILAKTSKSDSICNVDYVASLRNLFEDESLTEYSDMLPGQFMQPISTAKPLNEWSRYDFFRKKGTGAKSNYVEVTAERRFVLGYDTIPGKKGKKFSIQPDYVQPNKLADFFTESWSFDPGSGQFRKDIVYYGYFSGLEREGRMIGYRPVICFEPANETSGHDVLLKKDVRCDVAIASMETKLCNDTSQSTVADAMAVLATYAYGSLPATERNRFIGALLYYAYQHPSQVYPVRDANVDSLHPFQSVMDIKQLFTRWDSTNQVEDPNNPGTFVMAPLKVETYTQDVYAIRFYEDWYYDAETFTLRKKVRGIGLLLLDPYFLTPFRFLPKDAGLYIKVN